MKWWLMLAITVMALVTIQAAEPVRLVGTYTWGTSAGAQQTVEAVFTPAARPDTWRVQFIAQHAGSLHRFDGVARGDLDQGSIQGNVDEVDGDRRFMFRGRVRDGRLAAEHFEFRPGARQLSGTMILRRITAQDDDQPPDGRAE
jgi:hypothetical protein